MFHFPEKYRKAVGFKTLPGDNGAFVVPLPDKSGALCIIAADGCGWEHVSVHVMLKDGTERTPTWDEMCIVKDLFWDENDWALQYHPPKKDYVNDHPHTLHLWRPISRIIPVPDKSLV